MDLLIPIVLGGVLPIVIVWLNMRRRMNETNRQTQIVLAALEKNSDVDIEELMKKLSPKRKLLKEKLLLRLLWGSILAFLGVALIGYCVVEGIVGGAPEAFLQQTSLCGAFLLAIGIAFLINYFVGRRMLAREMEAEEAALFEKAKS